MGLPDNVMPEEKLPQCWADDVRMNALFAPFRLKAANPESWDMKMKFWSDMLRQWCKFKRDPLVSAGDAKYAFQRKGRTPACIDIVIEEMFRSGELSPVSKYQQILHNGPEGWVRWGARLAFRPAAFALTAVTSLMPGRTSLDNDGLPKASIDSTQRFVLESAVKDQATELLENYPSGLERIGTVDELMKNTNWTQSREVFEMLLGYLVSQGSAVKKDDIVKLADPSKKVTPVSDTDEALAKLVGTARRLEADLSRLATEAVAAEGEARAALQIGNRLAAKNHLRRKHKARQRAERCETALDNVHQLLQQMRDVDVNTTIVDTYKTSSEAMKRGMKEGGLSEDLVHDTMDDLKEVMETYNEIEKAVSTTVDDFDVAELEEELQELLASPTPPSGNTPAKDDRKLGTKQPLSPTERRKANRRTSERDFVFDGEERVLAELNDLSVEDSSPAPEKVALTDGWVPAESSKPITTKPSKAWYPPSALCLTPGTLWNNNVESALRDLAGERLEIRQDDRIHPGQPLIVDFATPPRHYSTDFQVRDHKSCGGVWLYNSRDSNSNIDSDLAASTEYFSSESPGKHGGNFQMAPGGERKKSNAWPSEDSATDDLERRLAKLRGFNL